jgi:hypothetical protein
MYMSPSAVAKAACEVGDCGLLYVVRRVMVAAMILGYGLRLQTRMYLGMLC